MLNTLPPSSNVLPPLEVACPGSLGVRPRHRGAQPLNHNALRYGLYAHLNPTPLTHFLTTFQAALPGLEGIPRLLQAAILDVRLQIARIFSSPPPANEFVCFFSWNRSILHLMGYFICLQKTLLRLQHPQRSLQLVAVHALALIHLDFRSNGITWDAYSFRENLQLSDFNSLRASSLQTGTSSGKRPGLGMRSGRLPPTLCLSSMPSS